MATKTNTGHSPAARVARMPSAVFEAYTRGLDCIAWNDEPTCTDEGEVASFISVAVLADAFQLTTGYVAATIVAMRRSAWS